MSPLIGGSTGVTFGSVHEIVLQHADFDSACLFVTRTGCIPQVHHTNSMDGDLMAEHKVSNHGISHLARCQFCSLTVPCRETVDFHDVIVLIFQWTSHLIKGILSVLA